MQARFTGWRQAASANPQTHPSHTFEKSALFEAAQLCVRALKLSPSCRFILDQLCAAYGEQPINGHIIVWPSNRWIEERTGISERTIRHAIRRMIQMGILVSHDSPNGKRYARRDAQGNITAAYGFDLNPLLNRLSEFKEILAERQAHERKRRDTFDAITIHRRSAQETLRALESDFPGIDTAHYQDRIERLAETLPRRSAKVIPLDAMRAWKELREELESMYISASDGQSCRHKDTNKYTPENPCIKGRENDQAATVTQNCPDACEILGRPRASDEILDIAGRYRGMLGVSHDGWIETREKLGDVRAGMLVYHLVQLQAKPRPGAQQIRNFGGYLRAMTRMIADGQVDLDAEISRHQGQSRGSRP